MSLSQSLSRSRTHNRRLIDSLSFTVLDSVGDPTKAETVDIFLGSVAQPDCHCTSLKVSGCCSSINSRANVGRKFITAFDFN